MTRPHSTLDLPSSIMPAPPAFFHQNRSSFHSSPANTVPAHLFPSLTTCIVLEPPLRSGGSADPNPLNPFVLHHFIPAWLDFAITPAESPLNLSTPLTKSPLIHDQYLSETSIDRTNASSKTFAMAPNFSLTKPTQAVPLKQCLKKAQAAYSDTRISFEVKVWVRGDCLKNLLNDREYSLSAPAPALAHGNTEDPHLVQLPNAHGCNLTVTPGWKVKYSGIRWQRIDITGSAVDPERTKRAVFAMLNTVHEAKDHKVGKHLGW